MSGSPPSFPSSSRPTSSPSGRTATWLGRASCWRGSRLDGGRGRLCLCLRSRGTASPRRARSRGTITSVRRTIPAPPTMPSASRSTSSRRLGLRSAWIVAPISRRPGWMSCWTIFTAVRGSPLCSGLLALVQEMLRFKIWSSLVLVNLILFRFP